MRIPEIFELSTSIMIHPNNENESPMGGESDSPLRKFNFAEDLYNVIWFYRNYKFEKFETE